jgi:hypothetical protein
MHQEEFMTSHFRAVVLSVGLVTALLQVSAFAAAAKETPAAPIPAQILGAKKIFIVNAGGDEMAENDPIFSGGPDRAYNQFYAAMKSWDRFKIVGWPTQADLVLEIRQQVSTVELGGKAGGSATPILELKIRDAKTNAMLWGFHIHFQFGLGQGASDSNFDQAVERLAMRLQALMGQPAPAAGATNGP